MGTLHNIVSRVADFVFRRRRRVRPARYAGRDFSKPELLHEAVLPPAPGLYAIHVRTWLGNMKLMHVGASENLRDDLLIDGHEGFMHLLGLPQARRGLWVSYHSGHDLDAQSRAHESERLNRHYFPRRAHSLEEHLTLHRVRPHSEHHRTHHGHQTGEKDRIR